MYYYAPPYWEEPAVVHININSMYHQDARLSCMRTVLFVAVSPIPYPSIPSYIPSCSGCCTIIKSLLCCTFSLLSPKRHISADCYSRRGGAAKRWLSWVYTPWRHCSYVTAEPLACDSAVKEVCGLAAAERGLRWIKTPSGTT